MRNRLDFETLPIHCLRISLAGETILSIAYDIDIKPVGDPYVEAAEETLHAFVSGTSGGTLFDFIPWRM